MPNESTGFSPFELVFGHAPRGPLKVVKEQLLSDETEKDSSVRDYISKFRERLMRANEVAREHLKSSQQTMKECYDRKAKSRQFEVGDKVLVLLPMQGDALTAKFSGPYVVEKQLGKENYLVTMTDRRKTKRVCHINMIKKYHERVEDVVAVVGENMYNGEKCTEDAKSMSVACESAVKEVQDDAQDDHDAQNPPDVSFKSGTTLRVENSKVLANPELLLSHLSDSEKQEVVDIFQDFPDVCSDKLGCAKGTVHKVDVEDNRPIKQHPYRLHPDKKAQVNKEVEYMLEN